MEKAYFNPASGITFSIIQPFIKFSTDLTK